MTLSPFLLGQKTELEKLIESYQTCPITSDNKLDPESSEYQARYMPKI